MILNEIPFFFNLKVQKDEREKSLRNLLIFHILEIIYDLYLKTNPWDNG